MMKMSITCWSKDRLFAAFLMLVLGNVSAFASTYRYTYTGLPFDTFYQSDSNYYSSANSIALQIDSHFALVGNGLNIGNTPGLTFSFSDGLQTIGFPPIPDAFNSLTNSYANLVIGNVDSAGLPTNWNIYLSQSRYEGLSVPHGLPTLVAMWSQWDTTVAGTPVGQEGSCVGGCALTGASNNMPGHWSLSVIPSPVPELPLPAMLGVGLLVAVSAARMARRHRAAQYL
jgi:hypothetical protein